MQKRMNPSKSRKHTLVELVVAARISGKSQMDKMMIMGFQEIINPESRKLNCNAAAANVHHELQCKTTTVLPCQEVSELLLLLLLLIPVNILLRLLLLATI
jgi:hypothetical protein